jgi:hypothetical protein
MERKETFEVVIKHFTEYPSDYTTVEETQARSVKSTELNEKFCEIYAGGAN